MHTKLVEIELLGRVRMKGRSRPVMVLRKVRRYQAGYIKVLRKGGTLTGLPIDLSKRVRVNVVERRAGSVTRALFDLGAANEKELAQIKRAFELSAWDALEF